MKYFIYLSTSKIDMLYDQITPKLRDKLAAELKIDLNFLSATFSEAPSPKSRYAKLDVVLGFLQDRMLVGTTESPKEYFHSAMKMKWGPLGDPSESGAAFFVGKSDHTTVGLGGSMKHVLGHEGQSSLRQFSGSEPYAIFDAIRIALEFEGGLTSADPTLFGVQMRAEAAINLAFDLLTGPFQKLEFTAKKLFMGPEVLVGTPLYVSLADESGASPSNTSLDRIREWMRQPWWRRLFGKPPEV